jgi:multidrug efflux pump subunit AcrA (membrane-fusion protein)
VPLEDLPSVAPGQPVRIETAALDGPLNGQVLYSTSVANIQKNTLEVKVAIEEPPSLLKPDMLVQVTFLAKTTGQKESTTAERLRLFIPNQLVRRDDQSQYVWVADQTSGAARRQRVKTGALTSDGLAEVIEGLTISSKLIVDGRDGLRDGARIVVTGEDATLGTSPAQQQR